MAFDLKPGDECTVKGDFFVEGKSAFLRGDQAVIQDLIADPQRPGFKYVVHSERLGRLVRLRGIDLNRNRCPECHDMLIHPYETCLACGWEALEKERVRETRPSHGLGGSRDNDTFFDPF